MAALLSKDDFRRIGLSLALAVVMIAGGAAAVVVSNKWVQAEQKTSRAALAQRNDLRSKLARAREEELELKQKIARFNDLSSRGIIGEEQRLDWIEQIRQIRKARKLLEVQYEIAPQRTVESGVLPGSSGNFEFLASAMRLKMELLHEEDLLNFLADLRASVHAYLRIGNCTVERLPRGAGDRGGAQLKAECTIDWITIRERKGT